MCVDMSQHLIFNGFIYYYYFEHLLSIQSLSILNAVDNKNACIPRSDFSSAIRWYASIYHSKTQKSEYLRVKHLDS